MRAFNILAIASTVSAASIPRAIFQRAHTTTDVRDITATSFDFVIAGGGLAGLALAARLSEWSNVTVAVIEAGTDQTAVQERVDMPGKSYLGSLTGSDNDWKYNCTDGSPWPRGKILGGSGAINGAFWTRGGRAEYDAWNTLQNGAKGAENWGWEEVQKYIKKSETFTPMPNEDEFFLTHELSAHGTSGPIKTSFSSYQFPLLKTWVPTLMKMGMPSTRDPASGINHGASAVPSTINPGNGSRSDSTDYLRPIARSNLVVLTGYQVVRIEWKSKGPGDVVASGLVLSTGEGQPEYVAKAKKEVILSGGVVGSPQILQLSGIGPQSVLKAAGIDTVIDLAGVGANVQDHVATSLYLKSTADPTWATLKDASVSAVEAAKWQADGTGMWTYLNEFTGYASLIDLMGVDAAAEWTGKLYDNLGAIATQTKTALGMDDSVTRGVKAQYDEQARLAAVTDVGQVELIMTMLGAAVGDIGIQVALQRPFARGTININSISAFTPPTINPNYYGDSHDLDIMLAGLKFIRQASKTPPLSESVLSEILPGSDVTSDDALLQYIKSTAKTEFHPSSSCSMLPLDRGGVVDTRLLVYGTANVRVVDASIIPLNVAAHLMATTYGIAEKAADIIKRAHEEVVITSTSSGSKPGSTSGSNAQDGDGDGNGNSTTSGRMAMGTKAAIGAGIGAAFLLLGLVFCLRRSRKSPRTPAPTGFAQSAGYKGLHSPTMQSYPLAPFQQGDRPESFTSVSTDDLHPHPQYSDVPPPHHGHIG